MKPMAIYDMEVVKGSAICYGWTNYDVIWFLADFCFQASRFYWRC